MESIAQIVPSLQLKPQLARAGAISPIKQRLLAAAAKVRDSNRKLEMAHQHTVLCQTCLPHSDPANQLHWDVDQGDVMLRVRAGEAADPHTREWRQYGLPWGARARLIHIWMATQAKKHGRVIPIRHRTITSYTADALGLSADGDAISSVADQLMRVTAAMYHFAFFVSGGDVIDFSPRRIVSAAVLSATASGRLVLPEAITLEDWYYDSLQEHAVPLDPAAIDGIKDSTLALDLYVWLAQRLHRIPVGKPQRVSWQALCDQFGCGYNRKSAHALNNWRKKFRIALDRVRAVYPAAKIEDPDRAGKPSKRIIQGEAVLRRPIATGIILYHSAPPIRKRLA